MEQMNVEQQVWHEKALTELLGVEKVQLDILRREEGFPYVRLNSKKRVYLAKYFVPWLEKRSTPSKE